MKPSIADLLPHSPPAVLLQQIEERGEGSLTASVILDSIDSPWIEPEGMPVAFGLEIIAQAAALLISETPRDEEETGRLIGGRLASCNRFSTGIGHLPIEPKLFVTAELHGASSMGYFQIHGDIRDARGELLSVECTVLALRES